MKIDKFSFFVGVAVMLLVIGCMGAVTIEDGGRFEWSRPANGAGVSHEAHTTFSVLDRNTGTVNVWDRTTGQVVVYQFKSQ